ncbi:hypothetical protein [Salinarimonas soli]|uniref:Uncharacterized protein n=1 Tax=Salinarimonas soli TaxID=1638099 RepID=A0A5B2W061_9HYPH|nr:hypothetical protein [Salinarimonas soli]KAA2244070.1 hypothetical protein F0L46_02165 [Salinarimonas soli]
MPISAEQAVSVLIPLVVLAILWSVVRHWILPFVLGFTLAVALGPQARPLVSGVWSAVAGVGDRIFGSDRDDGGPPPAEWERRRARPGEYEPDQDSWRNR